MALADRMEGLKAERDESCWSGVKPDRCAKGVGLNIISRLPPLTTSNLFGVLSGMAPNNGGSNPDECVNTGKTSCPKSVAKNCVNEKIKGRFPRPKPKGISKS